MKKIVIIGAGLTGLSAAYHLEQNHYDQYCIVEKEKTCGGLCRSIFHEGFTFDFTGHLLHINDPYFKQFIEKIAPLENFHVIERSSFIYSHQVYTRYPFQINLYGLPSHVVAECIEEFVKRAQKQKAQKSFYHWVLAHFGKGFAKHFFVPYQQKIFCYDPRKLTATWTDRFVPKTSLKEIIEGSVQDNKETIGYNANFFYPKKDGISFLIKKLISAIKKPILTEYEVKTIDMKQKKILFTNGEIQEYDRLITTMPLNKLLTKIKEPSNLNLGAVASKLQCTSVLNFNLGIARKNLTEKHWIYFPEKSFPFYRLGFYHNFSSSLVPPGCSSLYGEISCLRQSKSTMEKHAAEAYGKVIQLLGIDRKEIIAEKSIFIPHAYVIYNQWRDQNLAKIHQRLQEHDIFSIGRYGAWKYSSMQESVLDGKETGENLIGTNLPAYVPAKELVL